MTEEPKKVNYDEFKEFHDRHPDMDNTDFYVEFPGNNKGTLRSWKAKARLPISTSTTTETTPEPEGNTWDKEMLKLLCTQTNTPLSEFNDVDTKSALIILKNKLTGQQAKPKVRPSNSNILPNPPPIGQKTSPMDDFIVFDDVKNEIRMEIPMDTLMDPGKNMELRGQRRPGV